MLSEVEASKINMKNLLIIRQAAKFILVGILNTLIDLGVLNLLIFATGIATGLGFSAFKGISFLAAVINSYFLNRFWTFKSAGQNDKKKEFSQFFIISVIGFGINVGIASLVVNVIGNQLIVFGISDKIWANIGALAATFVSMVWNFIGYKFIVVKV